MMSRLKESTIVMYVYLFKFYCILIMKKKMADIASIGYRVTNIIKRSFVANTGNRSHSVVKPFAVFKLDVLTTAMDMSRIVITLCSDSQ